MYGESMRIQLGQIYINRTRKYLFPLIKEYGTDFTEKINSLFKVGIGIGDMILGKSGIHHERHMFILVDIAGFTIERFLYNLNWLRQHPAYEDDYAFDHIANGRLHMIVIKIPESHLEAFNKFKCGKFSKMYDINEIKSIFNYTGKDEALRELYKSIQKVLIHDHNYKVEFAKQIEKEFDVKKTDYYEIDPEGEFDFPILTQEEFFNVNN